jgi:hypothetical protein
MCKFRAVSATLLAMAALTALAVRASAATTTTNEVELP